MNRVEWFAAVALTAATALSGCAASPAPSASATSVASAPVIGAVSAGSSGTAAVPSPTPTPQHSVSAAGAKPFTVDGIPLVNATHPVGPDYKDPWESRPKGLNPEFYAALQDMFEDAEEQGVPLSIKVGYRSYEEQEELRESLADNHDQAYVDAYAAKPGTSEHQTGLAADLQYGNGKKKFADTPGMAWVAKHGPDYGMIVRFPPGKTSITGVQGEAWHVRWVGKDTARAMAATPGITLEEYLGQA